MSRSSCVLTLHPGQRDGQRKQSFCSKSKALQLVADGLAAILRETSAGRPSVIRLVRKEELQQLREDGIKVQRQHTLGKTGRRRGWPQSLGLAAKSIRGTTIEDRAWREAVLCRDGHECVVCGSTERLEADHIKPFHLYPELRFSVDNGQTLCRPCHIKTETYGAKVHKLVSVTT